MEFQKPALTVIRKSSHSEVYIRRYEDVRISGNPTMRKSLEPHSRRERSRLHRQSEFRTIEIHTIRTYRNIEVRKCACANAWTCNFGIPGSPTVSISGNLNEFPIPAAAASVKGYPRPSGLSSYLIADVDICKSRYPGFRKSGSQGMRISGFPDFRKSVCASGNPEIRQSGKVEIRKCGIPNIWI